MEENIGKTFKMELNEYDIKLIIQLYDLSLKSFGIKAIDTFNGLISKIKLQIKESENENQDNNKK